MNLRIYVFATLILTACCWLAGCRQAQKTAPAALAHDTGGYACKHCDSSQGALTRRPAPPEHMPHSTSHSPPASMAGAVNSHPPLASGEEAVIAWEEPPGAPTFPAAPAKMSPAAVQNTKPLDLPLPPAKETKLPSAPMVFENLFPETKVSGPVPNTSHVAKAEDPIFAASPVILPGAAPRPKENVQLVREPVASPAPGPMLPDTKTLTGEVERWRASWRLRYAGLDVVDANGGVVELEGDQLQALREGCQARVQGQLLPASAGQSQAIFRVQSLEVLSK